MIDPKLIIRELTEKLGFDAMKALAKANPITQEQLNRVADAVMKNRHNDGEKHG
jgi:hypothetical protein